MKQIICSLSLLTLIALTPNSARAADEVIPAISLMAVQAPLNITAYEPEPKEPSIVAQIPEPPNVMPNIPEGIPATGSTETGFVVYPVKVASKILSGDLDPSIEKTKETELESSTQSALDVAMQQRDEPTPRKPKDHFVIASAPVPKERPAKQIASADFVRNARRNVVDTYTSFNPGEPKPVEKTKTEEAASTDGPIRLSLSDIKDDPLASKLVDLSPEDIARTLNAMNPASGASLDRELRTIAKPKIVREMGEWIRKDGKPTNQQVKEAPVEIVTASATTDIPDESLLTPVGPFSVAFKKNQVTITDETAAALTDTAIGAMQKSPGSRLQISAYASAPKGKDQDMNARRISLSRALAVRTYLIDHGIDSTRLDVRALGLQPDKKAEGDKVDIMVIPAEKKS